MAGSNFVVCVQNAGHGVSLNRGSRYRLVPDADASAHHRVRVIDESGEDYLYPEFWFRDPRCGDLLRSTDPEPPVRICLVPAGPRMGTDSSA